MKLLGKGKLEGRQAIKLATQMFGNVAKCLARQMLVFVSCG